MPPPWCDLLDWLGQSRVSPLHLYLKVMLTCDPIPVNATEIGRLTEKMDVRAQKKGGFMADVTVQDGIILIKDLNVQDPKAVAVLMEYPEARWAEVTRRAIKIGLGYLKGGAQD